MSVVEPDWTRERPNRYWDPPRNLLKSIRDYQKTVRQQSIIGPISRRFAVLRHRFWQAVTGADIPLNAVLGGGLLIPHPNGIVINPHATIGVNCLIMQGVTIGSNRNAHGAPTIGNHVDIGPGARILGPVTIGDFAVIGANAVVLIDVPPRGVALGVPARIAEILSDSKQG